MKTIDSNHPPAGERSRLCRIFDRLFFYESMSGAGTCPVYLERWTLALGFRCGVYLHHFIGDDWALDPHDHPRRFISIGLWGWYWEDVFRPVLTTGEPGQLQVTRHDAPWIRTFPANHLHRVRASECGNCWTLVMVLPKSRSWGFVQDGRWIHFKEYVFGGKSRKAC